MTQQKINADNQAAADAEVARGNAQATLNSANATLNRVQTQQQNDANVNAAQIAATAEIVRANAQATLISAGSTQSAALIAAAIHQTQMAGLATTGAQAVLNQQYKDDLTRARPTRRRRLPPNDMLIKAANAKSSGKAHHIPMGLVPSSVPCAIGRSGSLGSLVPTKDSASQPTYSRKYVNPLQSLLRSARIA